MQFAIDPLRVEITTKGCEIPVDELERLQSSLVGLRNNVADFPEATLTGSVVYHAQSERYHAEFKLKVPGRTLFIREEDPYLDSALQRSFAKLTRKAESYREQPDQEAVSAAERQSALDTAVVAPEDPATGPLAEAAQRGDYRTFRTALSGYEEWLRKRVGRLVQRHPEAQAQVGKELRLGDVVEEVYLNAFEEFTGRPANVPLSAWLEGLIEPSLRALLQHTEEESTAASLARTVRATSLP